MEKSRVTEFKVLNLSDRLTGGSPEYVHRARSSRMACMYKLVT